MRNRENKTEFLHKERHNISVLGMTNCYFALYSHRMHFHCNDKCCLTRFVKMIANTKEETSLKTAIFINLEHILGWNNLLYILIESRHFKLTFLWFSSFHDFTLDLCIVWCSKKKLNKMNNFEEYCIMSYAYLCFSWIYSLVYAIKTDNIKYISMTMNMNKWNHCFGLVFKHIFVIEIASVKK